MQYRHSGLFKEAQCNGVIKRKYLCCEVKVREDNDTHAHSHVEFPSMTEISGLTKYIVFPFRTEISSFIGSPRVTGIVRQKHFKSGPGYSQNNKRHGPNNFWNCAPDDEHTQTSNT